MSLRIYQNVEALNAHRQLAVNQSNLSKSIEKLSSGLRINRASDDAAGLAISEKMRGQIRGLKQAQRNAQDGISLIQTAEGALQEVHAILQRMRELAVQAANDTNTLGDRKEIQKEINQLIDEIDLIAKDTEFNTQKLLNGDFETTALVIHIGANAGQKLDINIANMQTTALGTDPEGSVDINGLKVADVDSVDEDTTDPGGVLTQADADKAITNIQDAINQVSAERSKLGAYQNRLEHTIANLGTAAENLAAAESRIRDVDMAAEMMEFTKNQILQQAGVAMLAQANMAPQAVLQLLR
jgi:flagellin